MDSFLLILTACLVAIPASILGVILMMKQLIMVADAISHAVLPGIVLAYLLTNSKDELPVLLGAAAMGIATTFLIDFLSKMWKIQSDAAIGISFTFLFAIGVLLIAFFAGKNTDLDQDCVLYGNLETSILDQVIYQNTVIGTITIWRLIPFNVVVLSVILIANKALKIVVFNSDFGQVKGMKISGIQFLVLAMVSCFSVLSFDSVGVIMVIGLLVLPGATVLPHTRTFKQTLFYSACIGILSCVLGVFLGMKLNCSIAPVIVSVNAVIFALSLFLETIRNRKFRS